MTPMDQVRATLSDKQWKAIHAEANKIIRANDADPYLGLLYVLACRKQEQFADMSAEISPYEKWMGLR